MKKESLNVIILAAGMGTRMHSEIPKVAHLLCNKPIINHIIETVIKLNPTKIFLVLGHKHELVESILTEKDNIEIIIQKKQLGTGHAVLQCFPHLNNNPGNVLVLSGDVPLIETKILKKAINELNKNKASSSVLTVDLENPSGYGRIIRENNTIKEIKEDKDATKEEKSIKEINSGLYVFNKKDLLTYLPKVNNKNKQKEYYLTDIISILVKNNKKVIPVKTNNIDILKGINDRIQLSELTKFLYKKTALNFMKKGVMIIDPENTYITNNCKIGKDTTIYPSVYLDNVTIGKKCFIGPNTQINNSKIGNENTIIQSYINDSIIGNNIKIGPFAQLRPGTVIKNNAKIGNFVELKNTILKEGSKASHLTYLGDAEIGKDVNIGCGVITCNYDGFKKYKTEIGNNVFIGSDSQLVAPITIGENSYVASGSTIVKNVPDNSLAIARSKQINKIGYVDKLLNKIKGTKDNE